MVDEVPLSQCENSDNKLFNLIFMSVIALSIITFSSWLQIVLPKYLHVSVYGMTNIEYSYFNITYNTFTIIDHFIVTKHLYDSIVKHYSLCDEVDNQSDHCTIVLTLNIDVCQSIHSPTANTIMRYVK